MPQLSFPCNANEVTRFSLPDLQRQPSCSPLLCVGDEINLVCAVFGTARRRQVRFLLVHGRVCTHFICRFGCRLFLGPYRCASEVGSARRKCFSRLARMTNPGPS